MRRPFPTEAVNWKVQVQVPREGRPSGGVVVAYIDARLVIDRLNLVIPHKWEADFKPTSSQGMMLCELTVDGVTHRDVGESTKGLSKDLFSDALKRAAVQFGVGVSIYALPTVFLQAGGGKGELAAVQRGPKWRLEITDGTEQWLREAYQRWLEREGTKRFGPPLAYEETMDPEAFGVFREHGAELRPGGGDEAQAASAGPDFDARADKLDKPKQEPRQEAEPKAGAAESNGDGLAVLRDRVRAAFGALGEDQATVDRKLDNARDNARVLEVLLRQAEQRWNQANPDTAPPWLDKEAAT